MRKLGILEALHRRDEKGLRLAELARARSLPAYGVRVLLEAGLSSGIVRLVKDRYILTKTGFQSPIHKRLTLGICSVYSARK